MKVRMLVGFVVGAAVVCAIAWLGGYDFNERGDTAVVVALMSMIVGLGGAAAAEGVA